MHQAFRVAALCLGCLAAGIHWDALQVIAWTSMLRDNARTLAPAAAIARTFSPEGRCTLCHAIEEGRREQRQASPLASGLIDKPPLIAPGASVAVVPVPARCGPLPGIESRSSARRDAPPLPPPRVA